MVVWRHIQRGRQTSGRPRTSTTSDKPQSGRRRLSYPPLRSRSEDHIGGLFADHIDGTDCKETGAPEILKHQTTRQARRQTAPAQAAEAAVSATTGPSRTS